MRRAATAILLVAMLGAPRLLCAQPPPICPQPGKVWVELEAEDSLLDAASRTTIEEQLKASLRQRDIDLCARGAGRSDAPAAVAQVSLSNVARAGQIVLVTVSDRLTRKRVEREVDLSSLPADGRALALALSADELLRASWAELLLVDAPKPTAPVPAPIEQAITPPEASPAAIPAGWLGVAAAGEHYAGGQTQLGLDLRASLRLTRRASLLMRLGVREGLPAESPHGRVLATALPSGIGVEVAVLDPLAPVGLSAVARLDVLPVYYRGSASSREVGPKEASAIASVAFVGAVASLAVSPRARLFGELGAGGALRRARAADLGEIVTGVSGAAAALSFGAAMTFP